MSLRLRASALMDVVARYASVVELKCGGEEFRLRCT